MVSEVKSQDAEPSVEPSLPPPPVPMLGGAEASQFAIDNGGQLQAFRDAAERERRFRLAAQRQVNELMEKNMVLMAQVEEAVERIRFLESQANLNGPGGG